MAREQKEAAHDDVRMSTWCDDDTEQRAVLSEGRELLSVCGHLHFAYGTGTVVLRRKAGRDGGRGMFTVQQQIPKQCSLCS